VTTGDSVGRLRWWLCGLLFVATAMSFMDRMVLSALAPEITRQLDMSNEAYAQVNNAFLFSYSVMFLLGGRLLDVVGTRWGMTLSVGVWSLASGLHAAVHSVTQLGLCRFLLGMGEGGCFPGAAKGVAQWFAPRQRALAMGFAIGGASLGSVVATPLAVFLSQAVGWRGVFIVTGLIGAVWVVVWWLLSGRMTRCEAARDAADQGGPAPHAERVSIWALLPRKDVWGLALMRFIFDPVFYFYMFWIPKYLAEARGISKEEIGALAWIPFLALGISNVAGGWISDRLIRQGMPTLTARKLIMALAALLTMSSSLAGLAGNVGLAIGMMALLMFAHGFWITNYVTVIGDRFPQGAVGTVMGLSGAVGAVGGMLANTGIGWAVTHLSYGPVWLASGLLYPLAFVVLLVTVRGAGLRLTPASGTAARPGSAGDESL